MASITFFSQKKSIQNQNNNFLMQIFIRHEYKFKKRRLDTQHNDAQHNDTQHNDTQHNDTQHNDA